LYIEQVFFAANLQRFWHTHDYSTMKRFIFPAILIALIVALATPACYYDNEEELYGGNACDTTAISYATDIVPLLQRECYGCHDAANVSTSGIQLDTWGLLKDYADDGKLVDRTNDASSPMPPTDLMDNCSRDIIKAWVAAGAPDN
jgi:hypothetical protein